MLPSIASGGLELHLPFITMYRYRLSKATVHGPQSACGGTLPTPVMLDHKYLRPLLDYSLDWGLGCFQHQIYCISSLI